MVVCKYFLQGTCRYGSSCHYDHQAPGPQQHTSILRQPTFSAQQQQTKSTTNVDLSTLTKSVIADMAAAEKGGQWILSSYAPFKEKPAFPGFEDHSFEEIRFGFYESNRNGTLDQYKQQLQDLYHEALQKVRALQNPSQEIINILQNLYYSSSNNQNIFCTSNTAGSIFGSSTSNSNIFQGGTTNTQSPNIFASSQQQKSAFSGGSNIFATAASQNSSTSIFGGAGTSIFGAGAGGTAQPLPNQNIFGGGQKNSTSSMFVTPQQGGTFGTGQQNNAFGNPQLTASNIFANNANNNADAFGSSQQNNIFANKPTVTSQNTNIFSNQASQSTPTNSIFRTQSQPANTMFGSVQQPINGIFGVQPSVTASSSLFNAQVRPEQALTNQQNVFQTYQSQPPTQPAPNQSASVFGAPPPEGYFNTAQNQSSSKTVIFGGIQPNNLDESIYSTEQELTEEEKQWFLTDDLDISKIPEKPPTLRMCVKT